jgi:hypothetical protein
MSDIDCAEYERKINDDNQYAAWKSLIDTWRNSHQLASTNAAAPDEWIAQLGQKEADVGGMVFCLQEKIVESTNTPSDIANLQRANLEKGDLLKKKSAEVEIARERVDLVRGTAKRTSYYESWFPIDRPLRPASIPVLIGISLFTLTMCFGFVLTLLGIKLKFEIPFLTAMFYKYQAGRTAGAGTFGQQFTPAFWIVTVLLVGLTAFVAYGYIKK